MHPPLLSLLVLPLTITALYIHPHNRHSHHRRLTPLDATIEQLEAQVEDLEAQTSDQVSGLAIRVSALEAPPASTPDPTAAQPAAEPEAGPETPGARPAYPPFSIPEEAPALEPAAEPAPEAAAEAAAEPEPTPTEAEGTQFPLPPPITSSPAPTLIALPPLICTGNTALNTACTDPNISTIILPPDGSVPADGLSACQSAGRHVLQPLDLSTNTTLPKPDEIAATGADGVALEAQDLTPHVADAVAALRPAGMLILTLPCAVPDQAGATVLGQIRHSVGAVAAWAGLLEGPDHGAEPSNAPAAPGAEAAMPPGDGMEGTERIAQAGAAASGPGLVLGLDATDLVELGPATVSHWLAEAGGVGDFAGVAVYGSTEARLGAWLSGELGLSSSAAGTGP
ncbi:hypothetical protein EJ06DRAFT_555508 [Trichodelitschia bisporula]|uniref:Uncharacterized protein n=1 Tax=Trichodelitschia bisporula TaxID=703511 RepID=A0A6G1I131_9PEZI|nr:hypothetical protein EJ06DRAFT_555508 [Trichodelitschia bisporula]